MNMSKKQKIRFFIFLPLTLVAYFTSIIFLFVNSSFLSAIISIAIFYILFHFLYIELYRFKRYYLAAVLLAGILFSWLLINAKSGTMRITNIAFHAMIGLLINDLHTQTESKIRFNWFSYFISGWYLFTMWVSIVLSAFIVWWFKKLPMDCGFLQWQTDKIVSTITKPFKLGREKTQEISEKTKEFLWLSVEDIVDASEDITVQSKKGNPLLAKMKSRKDNIINKSITESKKLNNTICDYTVSFINKKLSSPIIQYSAIFLIMILLFPIIRLFVWILSFVALLIFEILYISKVYKKQNETRKVKRIR